MSTKDRVRLFGKHVLDPVTLLVAGRVPGGVDHVVTEPRITDAGEAFTQVSPVYVPVRCRFGVGEEEGK